jgi:hypothetical protein
VTLKLGWDLFLLGVRVSLFQSYVEQLFHLGLVTGVLGLWFCIEHKMQAHGYRTSSIFSLNICLDFQSQNLQNLQNLQKFILGYQVYP